MATLQSSSPRSLPRGLESGRGTTSLQRRDTGFPLRGNDAVGSWRVTCIRNLKISASYRVPFAPWPRCTRSTVAPTTKCARAAPSTRRSPMFMRIEAKYSVPRRLRDESINVAAGRHEVASTRDERALRYADHCCTLSEGRFDITSGVLRRAWDFRRAPPRRDGRPRGRRVARADRLGARGWRNGTVRLAKPGMELDFGGIGKEYAARSRGDDPSGKRRLACTGESWWRRACGRRPGEWHAWHIGITHPASRSPPSSPRWT